MATYYKAEHVREAARGKWLYILDNLAPELEPALRKIGKHVSCPIHGGKDGFRLFKDASATGGGICNSCGKFHDGFALLMWINDWDFKETLEEVGDYLRVPKCGKEEPAKTGNVSSAQSNTSITDSEDDTAEIIEPMAAMDGKVVSIKPKEKPWLLAAKEKAEQQQERERAYGLKIEKLINEEWDKCIPITGTGTDPLRLYFKNRGLVFRTQSIVETDSIRFNPSLPYYDEKVEVGTFPAIVCAIRDKEGNLVTLHRTYLTPDGKKANVESAKKMMPVPHGKSVTGCSIKLGSPDQGIIGVAEGLETALSVFRATQIPCWSTVNSTLMESFIVPEDVHTVLIWADKDKSEGGENSAEVLASKLRGQGINVLVLLPKMPIPTDEKSVDWNDILITQGSYGFPSRSSLRAITSNQAKLGAK